MSTLTRPKRKNLPKYALVKFIVDETLLVVKIETEVHDNDQNLLTSAIE